MATYAEAIKAANWAMKDDPECAAAHGRWLIAKRELEIAARGDLAAARADYEAAKAEWYRLTTEVFDRTMAAAGFGTKTEDAA